MNKHLQMFLGHESGSFTLAYVVFTQSSTWRTPGKSEPDCSHTWPALRAWQLKGPYRARLFTTLSKYKPASLSGMEVAAGSVVCCPNHTARGRGNPRSPPEQQDGAGHILHSLSVLRTSSPGTQHIRGHWCARALHLWDQRYKYTRKCVTSEVQHIHCCHIIPFILFKSQSRACVSITIPIQERSPCGTESVLSTDLARVPCTVANWFLSWP